MENLDMARSSRHAWQTIKKLDPDASSSSKSASPIEADQVAQEIKARGQHTPDYDFEKSIRKEYQTILKNTPAEDPTLTAPITPTEMKSAIMSVKNGKAAGIDGIFPDMITHLGPKAIQWLASTMTQIINTGNYPQHWRQAKVIAILKPGKPADDPASYRPISLLCCLYKLLERVTLTRLTPILDPLIPKEQAGFRQQRSTAEQVIALTSYIETGFENRKKTGAVLIDLSAAYDTVWTGGLMYKLAKAIPCRKTLRLLSRMTGTRHFHVILGGDKSRTRKIKNGVPQGSVLAPTLFNVYISDMPETTAIKLGYADDWVLAHQSNSWENLEETLSQDTTLMKSYFDRWYLRMNTTKTVASVFHLNNHEASITLKVKAGDTVLPSDQTPKYLGVTLDRTLSYQTHLKGCASKVAKRNNLLKKVAGTRWGASQSVLRTTAVALCYSAAEYCAPAWVRSKNAKLVDTKLRETMRITSGCLKSTPNQWLPVVSSITPPHIRREEMNQKWIQNVKEDTRDLPIKKILHDAPHTSRLKSRNPFYKSEKENFNAQEAWREEWTNDMPRGGDIIVDPTQRQPGFSTSSRKQWVSANRIRTRHCRTAANQHRWKQIESPMCPKCNQAPQDTDHLVLHCPVTRLEGGYATAHQSEKAFLDWLDEHNLEV